MGECCESAENGSAITVRSWRFTAGLGEKVMPMKSQAQRKFLWANKPELGKEFEAKTLKGKKLPEKVKGKK